jgi:hypothetical protein
MPAAIGVSRTCAATHVRRRCALLATGLLAALWGMADAAAAGPDESAAPPAPDSRWPELLAAQYTFIEQWQSALTSPYQGHLSLHPEGDQQPSHTIGFYSGWAPLTWGQLYFDLEKFMGAGVSGATGLGGLTNGDVIREGTSGLKKEFYIARLYARFMFAFGEESAHVERGQDQVAGTEAAHRVELKIGRLSVADDFDHIRYAGSTRTQWTAVTRSARASTSSSRSPMRAVRVSFCGSDGTMPAPRISHSRRSTGWRPFGGQLAGTHWRRSEDCVGVGLVTEGS